MTATPVTRLRDLCLALPEASERTTFGAPTFRIRDKIFALYSERDGRPSMWVKAPPGSQSVLLGADPDRFFVPPYLGPKGCVGMRLDDVAERRADWREVATLVRRSFLLVAPRRLGGHLG